MPKSPFSPGKRIRFSSGDSRKIGNFDWAANSVSLERAFPGLMSK